MNKKSLREIVTFTRASGATWMNSAGNIVGVDFSSSTVANTAGLKQFVLNSTLGVDRGWIEGDTVIVDQQGGSISLSGTVTSYNSTSQNLIVNVTTASGSGSASSWRIGSTVPRRDYGYQGATLYPKGILIEEQRTNSIRNNTMRGAVAGTPGTLPTNWAASTALTGITREIVGTGTESGITYIDIRLSGTPSASGRYDFYFETSTGVAALNGQTWTNSAYFKLQAGSLTGVSALRLYFEEKNSGGGYLTEQNITITNPTSAALSTQRASGTRTLNQATTAFLLPGFNLLLTGAAIDITLRIGLPQLEQGAFATSAIPTTTAAATRSADTASVNTLSPWYNASEGTFYAEFQTLYSGIVDSTRYVLLADASTSKRIIYIGSGLQTASTYDGTTIINATGDVTGSISKVASAYTASARYIVTNGGTVANGVSVTGYPASSSLSIATAPNLCGHYRRITYYPRSFTNTQLQLITGS